MKSLTYSFLGLLCTSVTALAENPLMFEHTQTYCFGRYLVDIPTDTILKGQGNRYQDTKITATKMSAEQLKQKITARIAILKEGKIKAESFLFNKQISLNSTDIILLGYQVAFGSSMYSIDSFKWDHGWAFTTSDSPYDDKRINSFIEQFHAYLLQVRYRPTNQIPNEPGFCFENGFVANDGKQSQVEEANLAFRLKNNQDVRIRIQSMVFFSPEPTLLERQKAAKLDSMPGVKRLQVGKREVNGLQGEEALSEFPSDDKTGPAHNFVWDTLGEIRNPLKPGIRLEITTGEVISGVTGPSSLSTAQIKALYETIVKTIRLRPTSGTELIQPQKPITNQPA